MESRDISFEKSMLFDKWYCLNTIVKNCSKTRLNSTCLFTGVSPTNGSKFRAIGYIKNKQIYIGTYNTQYDAWIAYNTFQESIIDKN